MDFLVSAIPLIPLIGFLLNGIINKKMPQSLVGIIASGSVLISFYFPAISFYKSAMALLRNRTILYFPGSMPEV